MAQVRIARTVVSPKIYARAFIRAWRGLGYPECPTQAQCGVLYAQWIVETGGKDCWCWNIGNVKVTPAQVDAGVDWFDLPGTWEIIGGKRVVLPDGDPGRRFRAFSSLDEGMREHLAFLRNTRYRSSWPAVEAGDPDAFARALKAQGYYTAPVEQYAAIMVSAHKSWMKSTAFADALREVEASEADTEPEIRLVDQPIVHPLNYDLPGEDDDEPPTSAAE